MEHQDRQFRFNGWPRGLILCLLTLLILLTSSRVQAQPSLTGLMKEWNVMVPMRDGVRLATNIFRPDGPGRFPVVLLRTPYGKVEMQPLAEILAKRGYVGVWQDVRGRFDSEGEWIPFFHEAQDGYDTIQWAAEQPWSNGDVIMLGGSYNGLAQWLAAKEHNPHLKGLITLVTPSDIYKHLIYEGGVFALGVGTMWSVFVDGKEVNLADIFKSPWEKVFNHMPSKESLGVVNRDPKFFRDWIAHPTYDAYWQPISWEKEFGKFDFPVLHIGGWYDLFQKGTIENFQRMATQSQPPARRKQHLIIGPWAHQGQDSSKVGDVDFGKQSVLDLRIVITWLDHYFKSANNRATPLAPVKVFTMGENKWNEYESWPVPGTEYINYYFHSRGRANSAAGDGWLSTTKPGKDEPTDHYMHDPANPVPTRGGGNCCWPFVIPWGPLDQRSVEQRDDVLVYTTPALEEDLRVTGPVEIKLWIASSAPDTDFTGKLVDVSPDGFSMNLTDGIQRVAYRRSLQKPELLKPGTPTEIRMDLWNTSHVFLKGHRIRVEIASSNFPRYSRNFNTGRQPETETEIKKATQTIFHDLKRPARIVLPVLSR